MKCYICEVKAPTLVIKPVDEYYPDVVVCDDLECITNGEISRYSLTETVSLADYPAELVEYLEYA
jgi:hypothetical protein